MGYTSVKNMPRKQQKAVFARIGNGRTSFEKGTSNREKLLKEMSYQDLKAKGHKLKGTDADKESVSKKNALPKKKSFIQKFKTQLKEIAVRQKNWDLAHDEYLASFVKHPKIIEHGSEFGRLEHLYILPIRDRKKLQKKFRKKYPGVAKDTVRPNAFPNSFITPDIKFRPKAKKAYREVFNIELI